MRSRFEGVEVSVRSLGLHKTGKPYCLGYKGVGLTVHS